MKYCPHFIQTDLVAHTHTNTHTHNQPNGGNGEKDQADNYENERLTKKKPH